MRKTPFNEDFEDSEVTAVSREIAWLKRQRGEEVDKKEWRAPKYHRVASRGNVMRWDNSLQAVGLSLADFQQPLELAERGRSFQVALVATCSGWCFP